MVVWHTTRIARILLTLKIELRNKWQTKKKILQESTVDSQTYRILEIERTCLDLVASPLPNEEFNAQNNPLGYTVTQAP